LDARIIQVQRGKSDRLLGANVQLAALEAELAHWTRGSPCDGFSDFFCDRSPLDWCRGHLDAGGHGGNFGRRDGQRGRRRRGDHLVGRLLDRRCRFDHCRSGDGYWRRHRCRHRGRRHYGRGAGRRGLGLDHRRRSRCHCGRHHPEPERCGERNCLAIRRHRPDLYRLPGPGCGLLGGGNGRQSEQRESNGSALEQNKPPVMSPHGGYGRRDGIPGLCCAGPQPVPT